MSLRQVSNIFIKYQHASRFQKRTLGTKVKTPHPLLDKYRHFQKEDGIPVYQKGGFGDRILFQLTILLCIIGLSDGFTTLYSMAFKKKK